MKKFFVRFWFLFPIIMIGTMYAEIHILQKPPSVYEHFKDVMDGLILMSVPLSWFFLISQNKWWQFITSFIVSSISFCVLLIILLIYASAAPDGFGLRHKIPDGLEYNVPYNTSSSPITLVDSKNPDTYLQIKDGSQGGIYTYDFYYGPLPAGKIYLKCFEATNNIPLSESRIYKSSMKTIKPTKSFQRLVADKRFTIYEGDWGDYYAARIEVWFEDAATKKERKLTEKIYRVEGWSR